MNYKRKFTIFFHVLSASISKDLASHWRSSEISESGHQLKVFVKRQGSVHELGKKIKKFNHFCLSHNIRIGLDKERNWKHYKW